MRTGSSSRGKPSVRRKNFLALRSAAKRRPVLMQRTNLCEKPSRAGEGDGSELLHPGAELELPGPGAAVLAVNGEIAARDRVGVEQRVGPAPRTTRIAGAADCAVDDEMRDVDVLRRELAGEALRKAA